MTSSPPTAARRLAFVVLASLGTVALAASGLALAPGAADAASRVPGTDRPSVSSVSSVPSVPSSGPVDRLPLIAESFRGPVAAAAGFVASGTSRPCLTAGEVGSALLGGCASDTPDAAADGALRLTPASRGERGIVVFDSPVPLRDGLDISYTAHQWEGPGRDSRSGPRPSIGDGMGLLVADGAAPLDPAAAEGALGYAPTDGARGLPHGLLGLGIDTGGVFDAADPCSSDAPAVRGSLALRGPASDPADPAGSDSGYCQLAAPARVLGATGQGGTADRPSGHTVRVTIDPPDRPEPRVTVSWDGERVIDAPQPAALTSAATVRLGWAASTLAGPAVQELRDLRVAPLDAPAPVLALAGPVEVTRTTPGAPATVSFTPIATPDGPGVTTSLTASVDLPAALAFAEAPRGPGWTCEVASDGRAASCRSDASPVLPGEAAPTLDVSVRGTAPGAYSIAATVGPAGGPLDASAGVAGAVGVVARAAVDVVPTADPLGGEGLADDVAPRLVVIPVPGAAGVDDWSLATAPPGDEGTAAIDAASRSIVFVPSPGSSGVSTLQYTSSAGGVVSDPAAVTVVIRPNAGAATRLAVETGRRASSPALRPVGRGPFVFRLVEGPTPGAGTASVDATDGSVKFAADAEYSGLVAVSVVATDADGVDSAPVTVAFDVRLPPRAAAPTRPPTMVELAMAWTGSAVGQTTTSMVSAVIIGLTLLGVSGVRLRRRVDGDS